MKIQNEKTFLNLVKRKKKVKIFIILIIIILIIIVKSVKVLKKELNEDNKTLTNLQNNDMNQYEYIIEPYIKNQKAFCDEPNKFTKEKYEKEIYLSDVKFNEEYFKMYIYKSPNFILTEFKQYGAFEIPIGNSMIEALKYYALKFNITNNKDIFVLDIGGNVGWYPSILGKSNYSILTFEPFEKNYYVSMKNYCYLNKDSN